MYTSQQTIYNDIIKGLNNKIDFDFIEVKNNKDNISLTIKPTDSTLLSITNDKSNFYILLDNHYSEFIPKSIIQKNTKILINNGFCRNIINEASQVELLLPLIIQIYENSLDSYKDFDCCSKFNECSNKKECVQNNKFLAIRCGYRKKIKQNIIFFGINRNV